ncbi:MAG: hypothetical protein M1826_004449 [Phylliscum demangeonii]|nr:MAG: hypothetical protein M1826_004449 [Phylliscum demangeonii]
MTRSGGKRGKRGQRPLPTGEDPNTASLIDFDPYDILGLDPNKSCFPNRDRLKKALARATKHTHPFATSGRLTLPPCVQAALAFHTLSGPYRKPARAFWRAHHRSTWNPHAAVGSSKAGEPIPGQEGGASPEDADLLMAAAIADVESGADIYGAVLLGPYYPPWCSKPGHGSCPSTTVDHQLLSEHGDGDGDGHRDLSNLPTVTLGSFRRSLMTNSGANAVVAMLDYRGRYYRRVVPWTMAGEPLPEEDNLNIARSCPPDLIDYLPRFRNRTELQVMAVVREELARLQARIDAAARRQ